MISTVVLSGLVLFIIIFYLTELDGPGDIFLLLRNKILMYDELGNAITFITKLWSCFWCLGTWFSLPISIFMVLAFESGNWLMLIVKILICWLGAIAVAGMVNTQIMR